MYIKKIHLLILNKIKYIFTSLVLSRKTVKLLTLKPENIDLSYIWKGSVKKLSGRIQNKNSTKYVLMGLELSIDNLNWSKDYISNVTFENKRFDKINLTCYRNKNVDVNFAWQLSRSHFLVTLAQEYTKDRNYKDFKLFKDTTLDWIDNNKFLYGINWFCGMEVGIRAINRIIAGNLFSEELEKDITFKDKYTISLIQHAEYISMFPEFSKTGYSNNHAVASFTGLLFLALTLKNHPKSSNWLSQAVSGLHYCMKSQTYSDGVNFEGSIYYHRLVLELFAYSTILCISHNIKLKNEFIISLYKMFEFTSAYLDHNGNAPQVGDNDSTRLFIFDKNIESDHSYLLTLGEHIFSYKFISCCKKRNPITKSFLPKIKKLEISDFNIKPRKIVSGIEFENGGATVLYDDRFHAFISYFPIGQNGKGGHNHIDVGSFTLSVDGQQIIGDPGSYSYNRNKIDRDIFRSAEMHNTMIYKQEKFDLSKVPNFQLLEYYTVLNSHLSSTRESMEIQIGNKNQNLSRRRKFFIENKSFIVENFGIHNEEYLCYFILHPDCCVKTKNKSVIINQKIELEFKNIKNIKIEEVNYSTSYNILQESKRIRIEGSGYTRVEFNFINNK